jgi:hypothetical protein
MVLSCVQVLREGADDMDVRPPVDRQGPGLAGRAAAVDRQCHLRSVDSVRTFGALAPVAIDIHLRRPVRDSREMETVRAMMPSSCVPGRVRTLVRLPPLTVSSPAAWSKPMSMLQTMLDWSKRAIAKLGLGGKEHGKHTGEVK